MLDPEDLREAFPNECYEVWKMCSRIKGARRGQWNEWLFEWAKISLVTLKAEQARNR